MNWTEGKLARHSRARQSKQTVLRQKEHFAKARAGLLLNAFKQIPPPISLFPSALSRHSESHSPAGTPRRGAVRGDIPARPSARKRRRLSPPPRGHGFTNLQITSHHFGPAKKTPSKAGSVSTGGADESEIREKRRKLLRDKDWAGIRMQKPIPVHFEQSPSDERKWTRPHGSTADRTRHLIRDRSDHRRKNPGNLGQSRRNEGVRITVGSQEVRFGQESSVPQSGYVPTVSELGQPYRGAAMPSTFMTSRTANRKENLQPDYHSSSLQESPPIFVSSKSHVDDDESDGRRHLLAPVAMHRIPWLPPRPGISPDCDAGDSILAHVGEQASPIPASRKADNEVWRKFVSTTQSETGYEAGYEATHLKQPERLFQSRISPGVSMRNHQPTPSAAPEHRPISYDVITDIPIGHQPTSSYDSRQNDDQLGHSHSPASADRQNTSHPNSGGSSPRQGSLSYRPAQSGSASVSQDDADHDLGRALAGAFGDSADREIASPSSENTNRLSRITLSEQGDTSDSTESETGSVDKRVAGLREAALNLLSKRIVMPSINVKEKDEKPIQSIEHSVTDSDPSSAPMQDAAQETVGEPVRERSPSKDSDDIWYKYLFSETNTDDLHKQVLDEARKVSLRNVQLQGTQEGSSKTGETDWENNISTAATPGLLSTDATETGEDLASVSAAVSASHRAAIGSPDTTRTAGTVFHGWEGSGGPPYAAPSMQGSMSTGSTNPVQQDESIGGSDNVGMSQGVSDFTSSFSSRLVDPPQSVADNPTPKESFRFARPKLFVGKLSVSVSTARPNAAVKPVTMEKPKRGRPKKKARDGRANIKSIPVYHDDPIEEFDEAEAQARVEPSLFGALDTEY